MNWRRSVRSGTNGENCVELASLRDVVAVRDSKDPDGPKLAFSRVAFAAFAAEVKSN